MRSDYTGVPDAWLKENKVKIENLTRERDVALQDVRDLMHERDMLRDAIEEMVSQACHCYTCCIGRDAISQTRACQSQSQGVAAFSPQRVRNDAQ